MNITLLLVYFSYDSSMSNINNITDKEVIMKITFNDDDVLYATGKVARAEHNAERHKKLNGMTVKQALESRLVNKADISYDLKLGFMTKEVAKQAKKKVA